MGKVAKFLESADVAAAAGVTPATVKQWARVGLLNVAAVTPRGVRLFRLKDVEVCIRERAVRAARRPASGEAR